VTSAIPSNGRLGRTRTPRRGRTPTLSVVLIWRGERESLERCLTSLLPPCARVGAEVVVVRAAAALGDATSVAATGARFVHAPHDASVRQLRGLGMAEATGDIVALADERSALNGDWIATLLRRAGGDGADVLDDAGPRATDWGSYFSERGLFAEWRPDRSRVS
jgi:hypothetical protein